MIFVHQAVDHRRSAAENATHFQDISESDVEILCSF